MNQRCDPLSEASLPGGSGEMALLTAIDMALDVPPGELPGRVALVRRYLGAALDAPHGSRRATFKVLAQLIVRDLSMDEPVSYPAAGGRAGADEG
jgi:hypothetical protein